MGPSRVKRCRGVAGSTQESTDETGEETAKVTAVQSGEATTEETRKRDTRLGDFHYEGYSRAFNINKRSRRGAAAAVPGRTECPRKTGKCAAKFLYSCACKIGD